MSERTCSTRSRQPGNQPRVLSLHSKRSGPDKTDVSGIGGSDQHLTRNATTFHRINKASLLASKQQTKYWYDQLGLRRLEAMRLVLLQSTLLPKWSFLRARVYVLNGCNTFQCLLPRHHVPRRLIIISSCFASLSLLVSQSPRAPHALLTSFGWFKHVIDKVALGNLPSIRF